jgi:hypothetical protein
VARLRVDVVPVGALVLAVQTVCVAFSHAGQLAARVFTWSMLALMAGDALWDVWQVVGAR